MRSRDQFCLMISPGYVISSGYVIGSGYVISSDLSEFLFFFYDYFTNVIYTPPDVYKWAADPGETEISVPQQLDLHGPGGGRMGRVLCHPEEEGQSHPTAGLS